MNELQKDVHVWQAEVPKHLNDIDQLHGVLSLDEQGRAARFITEQLSQRYIVAHGLLRQILAKYTGIGAEHLDFLQGAHGKPCIAADNVFFNMSHAGDYVLYALTRVGEIGVDIEVVDRSVDYLALAKRFFTEGECSVLDGLEGGALQKTFFMYWTRKEAYLKMLGKGLVQPLSSIDVSTDLINKKDGYQITDIDVGNGCLAALAYPLIATGYKLFKF